ncbi:hypothetical protein PCANC_19410 [Puccinia coronata f. sp. avenae]|uniref:Uncharacterized protein n=1 Tax=Puccinia coronata f. sp. avenae TaxID=200324 RepID=A0A2N5V156_9BASI|nr:hypothetical protein PCANC_19410 [Puccinia coronata f. sp. avenae]
MPHQRGPRKSNPWSLLAQLNFNWFLSNEIEDTPQANQFSQAIAPDKQLLGPALFLGQANQRLLGLSRSAPTDNLPLQLVGNQVGTFSNACSR